MLKCVKCGTMTDTLISGLCSECFLPQKQPPPNYVGFYEDDPIYDLLKGIITAIEKLTAAIYSGERE